MPLCLSSICMDERHANSLLRCRLVAFFELSLINIMLLDGKSRKNYSRRLKPEKLIFTCPTTRVNQR